MSGASETATTHGRAPAGQAHQPRWHAFRGQPVHISAARTYVERHVADWPDDDRHWVGVCTSEIATNALLHTRSGLCEEVGPEGEPQGLFAVRVLRDNRAIRVEVADYGAAARAQNPPAADEHEGGLGLGCVVENLAKDWGYYKTSFGRVTWFEYALEAPSSTDTCGSHRGRVHRNVDRVG